MAKIAIVGAGISGLGAAYLLNPRHEITVYDKAARPGGHSRTVTVDHGGKQIAVDTGFIVFNRPNYPHFSAMLRHLGVAVHESDMTFAATIADGRFEWGARDLNAVFGQRRNLFNLPFYRICHDVWRFNRLAAETVERHPHLTLDGLIRLLGLGEGFRRDHLLPMGGAIWSCPVAQMLQFPAAAFVRFFRNHGLLAFAGQPQWYTVTGGAQTYVARLTESFAHRIRSNCGVASVRRLEQGVEITDQTGGSETFDHVVFACHGDEALAALSDASPAERESLAAFRYQENLAVLHKDESVMPKNRRCWASWVYRSDGGADDAAISVSYWMNLLQGLDPAHPLFVTLNPKRPIAEGDVFDRHVFHHPVFDATALAAQARIAVMQGARGTWFCGAHLRHGFHEDGLWSAVTVAQRLGARIPWTPGEAPQAAPAPSGVGAMPGVLVPGNAFSRGAP